MPPSQYLSGYNTRTSPNAGTYRNQLPAGQSSSPRPPTNVYQQYQQAPTRVQNSNFSSSGSPSHSSVPSLYKNSPGSRSPTAHSLYSPLSASASTTSELWEDATSEFSIPSYKHEVPSRLYKSRFSTNPYDTNLGDKAPRIWSPSDDDSDDGSPEPHQTSYSPPRAAEYHEARAEQYETRTDSNNAEKPVAQARIGGRAPRTAEQKARIAKSAANRRAKDRDNLAAIKDRLPPLAYGEEYNNRTALEGGTGFDVLQKCEMLMIISAIRRIDRDEEIIRDLRVKYAAVTRRLSDVERQIQVKEKQLVNANTSCVMMKMELDSMLGSQTGELERAGAQLISSQAELGRMKEQRAETQALLQHCEAELRLLREQRGWGWK
ncbi:hypothetical protein EVG20_g5131 [Dentipellis fragilis]|uniref:Uncharacterized protein n=1 Tax=Dentipellis fragilis TaxID=205917 RepID=A0A4Y9YW47_9AGAM|nr:hypothetical protein EVG20_g5131 [Dentipellis fragilis]